MCLPLLERLSSTHRHTECILIRSRCTILMFGYANKINRDFVGKFTANLKIDFCQSGNRFTIANSIVTGSSKGLFSSLKMSNMLKLKLEALEHPTPDKLDHNDRKVFASTILWLEDQKIRTYKIEERENLRKVDDMKKWEAAYDQYKSDLGMPKFQSPIEELSWILSYAIRLEFLDAPDNFKDMNSEQVAQQCNKSITPSIRNENFFDNMDFMHKDFVAGVRSLATKLKVPHHPNHLLQLEAIARIVKERMAPGVRNRAPVVGTPFPFEKGNDIVSPGDPNLDYPVRILRLLQIQSLRELQTHINETIVAVQNLTANPKTDTKLGKVGF